MYKLYSNEIVFRGHPDKCADQIAGAIVDECLIQDPKSRVAIECTIKGCDVNIFGELTTKAKLNISQIAKEVLFDIGYTDVFKVTTNIVRQSSDIAEGVDKDGAGDQGMMFGFACRDNSYFLPTAQMILVEFAKWYDSIASSVENMTLPMFKPDGKAQITGVYNEAGKLVRIKDFTISYQNPEIDRALTDEMIKHKALEICANYGVEVDQFLLNPAGRFEFGGPWVDSGLTGRKIVVDSYQSFAKVGGGSMNGKDPTKVDVSGAHKARQLALRYLAKEKAERCEVQLSYAIGISEPLAINIKTDKGEVEVPRELYSECTPSRIIADLELTDPKYQEWACFGHFVNREYCDE